LKRLADLVTTHHAKIDGALQRLAELRRAKGWQRALKSLDEARRSGEGWAKLIEAVDIRKGMIELNLEGRKIALDLRISAFENASRLYSRYKKLIEKAAGARRALTKTQLELDELRSRGLPEVAAPVVRRRRKPKWFERFRWFISSDGMLVIAGRDAATNEEIVEKHMQPGDRYLHANIFGAPHVVVKADGKEVSETTLREAAEFAAMHSRAWREGLGSIDVYWALPQQVSKQAPPGQYLPRGSYIIRGKRNFIEVPLEAAVGIIAREGERLVMCGPPSAVGRHSKALIRIFPGPLKKSDLAKEVQARLRAAGVKVSIDELMRALPPGKGRIESK
jgi:predicted ribosome quality control (RQC) complex YloA/Tae2 family protein